MTTDIAGTDARFIAQLRASCEATTVPDLLRGLYWDGSAVSAPWFDALKGALAGYDHVRCVTMLSEHKPGPMLSVVALLAFLSRQPAPAEWVHYNLAHELGNLLGAGVQEARMPMVMHAFVALELFPGNEYVQSLPHSLLASGLAHWMPREAVRHGLWALRMGNALALHDVREALLRLGVMPADGNLDASAGKAIDEAIGSAVGFQSASVQSRDIGSVQFFPVALPATVVHPRPAGDGHFYQFKRAGAPIRIEPVFIHQISGAALSCDVSKLGRTEIYCYAQGTCLSDLCLGTTPFLADDILHVDKPLMLVDDVFSGVANVSHFLLDQVPRLLAYSRLHPGAATLLQCDTSPYYKGALEVLGIEDVLTPPNRRFTIRTPTLFTMSNIVTRWDHPLNSGSARTASLVRDAFGVSQVQSKGRRLYISRADAGSRRAVNATEVEAVFDRHGVRGRDALRPLLRPATDAVRRGVARGRRARRRADQPAIRTAGLPGDGNPAAPDGVPHLLDALLGHRPALSRLHRGRPGAANAGLRELGPRCRQQ